MPQCSISKWSICIISFNLATTPSGKHISYFFFTVMQPNKQQPNVSAFNSKYILPTCLGSAGWQGMCMVVTIWLCWWWLVHSHASWSRLASAGTTREIQLLANSPFFFQQTFLSIFSRCWQRGKKTSRKKHASPLEVKTGPLSLLPHSVGQRKQTRLSPEA